MQPRTNQFHGQTDGRPIVWLKLISLTKFSQSRQKPSSVLFFVYFCTIYIAVSSFLPRFASLFSLRTTATQGSSYQNRGIRTIALINTCYLRYIFVKKGRVQNKLSQHLHEEENSKEHLHEEENSILQWRWGKSANM